MTEYNSRPYRSRLVRPCDACRKRRAACIRDTADEVCSLCRHRGQTCTFNDAPQLRRRQVRDNTKSAANVSNSPRRLTQHTPHSPPFASSGSHGSDQSPVPVLPSQNTPTRSTMLFDKTCLYSGSSSDQHPHLLRHLVYDEHDRFGDDQWTVWRVSNQHGLASYLTVYPNPHLDGRAEMYSLEKVGKAFTPYEEELVRLYYTYVHPSYPVLEAMEIFNARRQAQVLPSSLLAVVLQLGSQFWDCSSLAQADPMPFQEEIRPWIFQCLTFEARTPNLAVVQAFLLFMQMIPTQIRAPNHPGFWPLTNMLVGIAQDIGLHVDPTSWSIDLAECKMRRILWWAVLMHDTWMSHTLGRPPHVSWQSWNVQELSLKDFADNQGRLSIQEISTSNTFITLCRLTSVLVEVTDYYYSIRARMQTDPLETVLSRAREMSLRVQQAQAQCSSTADNLPSDATIKLLALAIRLSIQRAVFGLVSTKESGHAEYIARDIVNLVRQSMIPMLEAIDLSRPHGLWLSYLRGSLTMVGSLLITLVLSSVVDEDLEERRQLLMDYREYLKRLVEQHKSSEHFEFARLPLRRMNLIMEQLFGDDEQQNDFGMMWSPTSTEVDAFSLMWAT